MVYVPTATSSAAVRQRELVDSSALNPAGNAPVRHGTSAVIALHPLVPRASRSGVESASGDGSRPRARATAQSARGIPQPVAVSCPGVERSSEQVRGIASMLSGESEGSALSISATMPVTCGCAIDVPDLLANPELPTAAEMLLPGAA